MQDFDGPQAYSFAVSEADPWLDFDVSELAPEVSATVVDSAPISMETRTTISTDHTSLIVPDQRPWFLKDETWRLQQAEPCPDCPLYIEYEPYIDAVRNMLSSWVNDGHNAFIHPRLYDGDLPKCMEDAFTTLSAYINRTPAVKNKVLQILEQRAAALSCQVLLPEQGVASILAHLARFQAMFVYVFIGLFDGAVHARVVAERHIPLLRLWHRELLALLQGLAGFEAASNATLDYHASSAAWKLWVLTESARRTLLVVETNLNTYQMMTAGWLECPGCVMFTARQGLWQSGSAAQWEKICTEKSPLMIPSLRPEAMMEKHAADEIDDFVKLFWTYTAGPDRVAWWVDKSKSLTNAQ
jgi:hypothetical protein